jgi:hypothetical protein
VSLEPWAAGEIYTLEGYFVARRRKEVDDQTNQPPPTDGHALFDWTTNYVKFFAENATLSRLLFI